MSFSAFWESRSIIFEGMSSIWKFSPALKYSELPSEVISLEVLCADFFCSSLLDYF